MNDRRLDITSRNFVIQLWRTHGFADDEFDFTDRKGSLYTSSLLTHLPTGYQFLFAYTGATYPFSAQFTPILTDGRGSIEAADRTRQLGLYQQWIERLRKETSQRDLWAEIVQARAVMEAGATGDNTPFSEVEIRAITNGLDQAESQLVRTLKIEERDAGRLRSTFAYLRDRVRSVGRLDYRNIVAAQVLQLLVEYARDPETRRTVLKLVTDNLNYLFAAGRHLLQGFTS